MSAVCSSGGPVNNGPCGPAPCNGECVGQECLGECGQFGCTREDCRTCDSCGTPFDLDSEGQACDTYGNRCEDCGRVSCHSDCCYSGADTWAEYYGDK